MNKLQIKKWDRFWKLTIIEEFFNRSRRAFKCKCDCWNEKIAILVYLTRWHTTSCWCYNLEALIKRSTKHNLANSKIYYIWQWILARCKNKNNKRFERYWWRWIKCLWNSFEEFYKDMGESHKEWLSIERIDNDWNYCKENCKWIEFWDQNKNKSNTIFYKWKCLAEYCREKWLRAWLVYQRINTLKWDIKDALWEK